MSTLAQRSVSNERMELTPKRVVLCTAMTIAGLIFGVWSVAGVFSAIAVVWERPGSKVRLLCDAITKK